VQLAGAPFLADGRFRRPVPIVQRKTRQNVDKWLYIFHIVTAMDFPVSGFEWDHGNRDKCQTHGVPTAAIESMFLGTVAVFPDPAHSETEERFKAIGRLGDGRTILVVFTLRRRGADTFIRPLSARYMHRKEVQYYEAEAAKT
jgi:uncharacterized DUF497 family protein